VCILAENVCQWYMENVTQIEAYKDSFYK
jgi:hypothetical protein